jgi:hypothetical protein
MEKRLSVANTGSFALGREDVSASKAEGVDSADGSFVSVCRGDCGWVGTTSCSVSTRIGGGSMVEERFPRSWQKGGVVVAAITSSRTVSTLSFFSMTSPFFAARRKTFLDRFTVIAASLDDFVVVFATTAAVERGWEASGEGGRVVGGRDGALNVDRNGIEMRDWKTVVRLY